jgi:LacI family transcriptional regulator
VITCSGGGDPKLSPVVSLDDEAAGALAAQHLIDCRLERFAFYTPASIAAHVARGRLAGFRRIIEARGWECFVSPVPFPSEVDRLTQVHWPKLMEWLRQLPKPIGIFAGEDGLAHDLAGACLAADVGVPDHVAIIGVNNDDLLCEGAWPSLSSVEADFTRVGYHAAMLLDRMLNGQRLNEADRVARLPPLGVVQRVSTSLLAVSEPALADAIRFIREHACDPCSVDDVLREVPVGRRWLERQFVSQLGRTPHDEIIRVRIETAKRLLLQPELSVRLVGERCGFSRVQFGRAFRQVTGMTAAAYRRSTLRGEGKPPGVSVAKRSELDAN